MSTREEALKLENYGPKFKIALITKLLILVQCHDIRRYESTLNNSPRLNVLLLISLYLS